jgi:hypothetical protein
MGAHNRTAIGGIGTIPGESSLEICPLPNFPVEAGRIN